MTMKTYTLIILSVLTFGFTFSQDKKIERMTEDYDKFAYIKTSEVLLRLAEKGYESVELFQKLGNSFYFNNKMEEAAKWYGKLVVLEENLEPEYYFRYAQSLKSTEDYENSNKWMLKFHDSKPEDSRGKVFMSDVDYLADIEAASNEDINVKNLEFNSEGSDFGSTLYKGELIFASTRGGGREYKWNEQPFLDLYSIAKKEDGTFGTERSLSKKINSKLHESSAAFTPNDSIMYFTRNNFFKKKTRRDADGINRLQLFRSYLHEDGSWGEAFPIHFNSAKYSVAHPSVNSKGTIVYFAADLKNTFGQSDIYMAPILQDGVLGEPKNLGRLVNTEGQETFPFINSDGDLYFASNGYPGLGGLDIFVIRDFEGILFKKGPKNYVVENVAKPINSPQDDFAYFENLETKEGFFTSNRSGGKGDDDIYSFVIPENTMLVEGTVKDKVTNEIIPGATVILFDENGVEIEQKIADENGEFSFEVLGEKEHLIRVSKDKYSTDEQRFTTPRRKQDLELEFNLELDVQEVTVGDDLAVVLDIPIIYFDFDKSNIRRDASFELEKVVSVLNQNPKMKIDVRSHTDSRAPASYNQALSDRRNAATIKYLIDVGGIDASRLTGNGYGESQLVNKCADGVPCTQEEHQLNRRSEFIIVSTN